MQTIMTHDLISTINNSVLVINKQGAKCPLRSPLPVMFPCMICVLVMWLYVISLSSLIPKSHCLFLHHVSQLVTSIHYTIYSSIDTLNRSILYSNKLVSCNGKLTQDQTKLVCMKLIYCGSKACILTKFFCHTLTMTVILFNCQFYRV